MTAVRFFAIIGIFIVVSIGWMILGGTIDFRTRNLGESLSKEVDAQWGASGLVQMAPTLLVEPPAKSTARITTADPSASTIAVDIVHENRTMGLLWFSTYTVRFSGQYTVQAAGEAPDTRATFTFALPHGVRTFEDLDITVDSKPLSAPSGTDGGNLFNIPIPADGQPHIVGVTYKARGRDRWEYATAPAEASRLPLLVNFALTATTNFKAIDYPKGSISPVRKAEPTPEGMKAVWQYNNLRAVQRMGIEMPTEAETGAVVARMSYFAPVSLFFFFTALFTIVLLKQVPLHPMHYLFISAGFFAFHILMAYLIDHIPLGLAFWISAAVSALLVISYICLVAGARFAVMYVGLAQLVYLIGFSYAFLWKGYTGLTVVIGAIITLFVLMQATARVDWNAVFAGKPKKTPPLPPAPPAAPPAPMK